MFESKNRKSYNQNRKTEIGKTKAVIRIEATELTIKIVAVLIVAYQIFMLYFRNFDGWKSNQFKNGKFTSAAQCTGDTCISLCRKQQVYSQL